MGKITFVSPRLYHESTVDLSIYRLFMGLWHNFEKTQSDPKRITLVEMGIMS